jgi:hypothetical protein
MMPEAARNDSGNPNCSGYDMRYAVTAAHAALSAALLCASPIADAVMYKWVDDTGSVTYSNAPPVDTQSAREVTKIEDISPALGTRERHLEAAQRDAGGDAVASPPPSATRAPETAATAAPPRVNARPLRTEAVQDPCLTSADPQCHQRNKHLYDPYLGYAPSTLAPPAVGATAGVGAGGAVGGHIAITPGR